MYKGEKVRNDKGQVAVLYSPGYGSGWYTWNLDCPELLFHPALVKMVQEGRQSELNTEKVAELIGNPDFSSYCGGARDLRIMWLNEGTRFRVDEYDGSEKVVDLGHEDFEVA